MAILRVIEIFDSLQGEGFWSGVPMTFVRLAGCNAPTLDLACVRWCDTPESWDPAAGEELGVDAVCRRVDLPRLCLTGGEPLLQIEGVMALVSRARRNGTRVHLETNGTLEAPCDFDWVTVSPKPPGYMIIDSWKGRVDEIKLVADLHLDGAAAERAAAAHPEAVVCVQPEYGGGPDGPIVRESVERAVALVMGHPAWRLSLQTHKYLGIR